MSEHTVESGAPSQEVLRHLRDEAATLLHDEICGCGAEHRTHGRVYLEMAGTVVRALLPIINTSVTSPRSGRA